MTFFAAPKKVTGHWTDARLMYLNRCANECQVMNPQDFKKIIENFTEENITVDEPHVTMRCEENSIKVEQVKSTLLGGGLELIRVIEDRPKVYKLYYRLSRKTELKIVVDIFVYNKINIRTVKKLSRKFRLGSVKRQRF